MKVKSGVAIALSGALWMGIGILLLLKGFYLLLSGGSGYSFLLKGMMSLAGSQEQGTLLVVSLGLLVGFLKGRLVLAKTAKRVIARIEALAGSCSFFALYSRSYVILLASMALLGVFFKWIPLPYDLKGLLDVAIGSALVNGSAFYFRHLIEKRSSRRDHL